MALTVTPPIVEEQMQGNSLLRRMADVQVLKALIFPIPGMPIPGLVQPQLKRAAK